MRHYQPKYLHFYARKYIIIVMDKQKYIRNFCIIAHIDHGKSTLADRLIEYTGTPQKRELTDQTLDSMDIERERGITIKLTHVKMKYEKDGAEYELNLIDTPGHVDFSYEVSRALATCEGAILVVDATQGVEAQTLANVYIAVDNNLEILPVINKIDLPSARPEEVRREIEDVIGIDASKAPLVSAKEGIGIKEVLDQVARVLARRLGKKMQDGSGLQPMWVLGNESWLFGAASLLYPGVVDSFARKVGGDFYILPSSIHEVILLPEGGRETRNQLYEMVAYANYRMGDKEKFLSGSVYYYDSKKMKIQTL